MVAARASVQKSPTEWPLLSVADLGRVVTGGTPPTINPRFWGGELPWVTPTDIAGKRDISSSERMITPEGLALIRSLPPGSVLVTCIASIGKNAILRKAGACNQQINAVVPKSDVSPEFLYYLFCAGASRIWGVAGKTATPMVSKSTFESLLFAVPSFTEQCAIADSLSEVDELIDCLEHLIQKKSAIRQGVLQDLLSGRRRLPGFSAVWRRRTLGQLFEFKNGLNKERRFFGYGTPIINYMDVYASPYLSKVRVQGKVSVTASEADAFSARIGDVFFTRTSETVEEVGLASVLTEDIRGAVFSGFVLRARPLSTELESALAGYLLRSASVRRQIVASASYTTRALTNGRLLSKVEVLVPPRDEQLEIAATIDALAQELSALTEKLTKARQLKQGMMQELLTGRVRLV